MGIPDIFISIYFKEFNEMKNAFDKNSLSFKSKYEIRYDLFEDKSKENLIKILNFLNENNVLYIFTFRSDNNIELNNVYDTAIKNNAPIIDIDINSFNYNRDTFKNSRLMLSYHGNNNDDVIKILNRFIAINPDIYKIALTYTDNEKFIDDLDKISRFKSRYKIKIAFIPMGKNNSFLRIVSGGLVSDIVYAKYIENTAPGQLSVDDYNNMFKTFIKIS